MNLDCRAEESAWRGGREGVVLYLCVCIGVLCICVCLCVHMLTMPNTCNKCCSKKHKNLTSRVKEIEKAHLQRLSYGSCD